MRRMRLGDVARFINGAAFRPTDWSEGGLPIVRIQNLTDPGKPFNRTTRKVPDSLRARPGDLLVSWSATLGVFTWAGPGDALVNQHIFRVVPHDGVIEQGYLRHMLEGALFDMERHLHGATMKHVNRGEFLGTEIPVPPIGDQRRIAAILDQADALRTKRRQAIAHLDTLAQSIFLDMFGDPVRNTAGWPRVAFSSFATLTLGKMLDARKQTGEKSRPYLRNANIQWFEVRVNDLLEMDFSEADRRRFSLEPGDVLICEGGEPGRAAIWRGEVEDCYFQKALHRVRPDSAVATSQYIVWLMWFLAHRGGLRESISSATIAHLTSARLKSLEVPLPPSGEQRRFASRLLMNERARSSMRVQSGHLDDAFASLQDAAFNGAL